MRFAILSFFILFASRAFPQSAKLTADKSNSTITYTMKHPLHEWDGISSDVQSVIVAEGAGREIRQVAVKVKLNTFDSKNANRDSHMIEVAEGLKFPEITFAGTVSESEPGQLQASGTLRFHGVSKAVQFKAARKDEKGAIRITGDFPVKMTDFGIPPPSLLGIATEDEFRVSFSIRYSY